MIASNSDILNFLFDVESSRTVRKLQAVTNEALRSDKSAWKPSGASMFWDGNWLMEIHSSEQ